MAELTPNNRRHLVTRAAKDTARQTNADRVQQEVDAEKETLDERTAQLRAKRLSREKAAS
jgi:hypothetical protein